MDEQPTRIYKWDGASLQAAADELALEEPLELRVRGRGVTVTMRTPGHDADLAAGFLLTEGIIRSPRDILRAEHCTANEPGNVLNVLLAPEVYVDFDRLTRHVFTSSSCGICGKASIDAVRCRLPPVSSALSVSPMIIASLPGKMRSAQQGFDRTGGLHAAAVFDQTGELIVLREDVGRHNAVDKVIGHCLLQGRLPLEEHILLVSGRTSFEILQKSLAARIPIIAAVSAPTSLAVQFAQESGQTLIGFLRGSRMNIYAHPKRLGSWQTNQCDALNRAASTRAPESHDGVA
jgi:FdhD protein